MPRSTTYRVFLDANVIYSGVHSPLGTPGQVLRLAVESRYEAVVCAEVLREVIRNLNGKLRYEPPGLRALLEAGCLEIRPNPPASLVEPWLERGFRGNSVIIAAASEAEVDCLCTGDRRLLFELPEYGPRFQILSPRQLLSQIEEQQPS